MKYSKSKGLAGGSKISRHGDDDGDAGYDDDGHNGDDDDSNEDRKR